MPSGAADRGDVDMTPASAVNIVTGQVERHTTQDIANCAHGEERLRTVNIAIDCDGNPIVPIVPASFYPMTVEIANALGVADNTNTSLSYSLDFDIDTGTAIYLQNTVVVPIVGFPRTSSFGIHGRVTSGLGFINVRYSTDGVVYHIYEDIPLSANYPVDKIIIPSARFYFIYYTDINDGVATVGLYLQAVIYPPPK